MPNHIKNRIVLIGDLSDLDALIKKFSTEVAAKLRKTYDDEFICQNKDRDFCWLNPKTGVAHNRNGLNQIGLPEGYEPEIELGFLCFPDFKKIIPPPDDPAYRDEPSQEAVKDSPNWWYTWNINNWGSKWGGYSFEREAINIFTYETAWSPSPIIIEAISRAFPSVTIKYTWADEDTGHNCGRAVYHNGLVDHYAPKGGTKEAYEIAFELRPDRAENYKLIDGTYRYHESETEA